MKRILIVFLVICSFLIGFLTNEIINIKNPELQLSEETSKIIENDKIFETYMEFLRGERKTSANGYDINSIIIPTGEPNNRYHTEYTFFDSNGDDIPELHVKSAREYHILMYKDGDLMEWGNPRSYAELLNNGDFIYTTYYGMRETYIYAVFDSSGKESLIFSFGKSSLDENAARAEDNPPYDIGGIGVSRECYEYTLDAFLSIGSDKIKWVILCETKNFE